MNDNQPHLHTGHRPVDFGANNGVQGVTGRELEVLVAAGKPPMTVQIRKTDDAQWKLRLQFDVDGTYMDLHTARGIPKLWRQLEQAIQYAIDHCKGVLTIQLQFNGITFDSGKPRHFGG